MTADVARTNRVIRDNRDLRATKDIRKAEGILGRLKRLGILRGEKSSAGFDAQQNFGVALPNISNLLRIPKIPTKFALNLRQIKAPTQFVVKVVHLQRSLKSEAKGHTTRISLCRR